MLNQQLTFDEIIAAVRGLSVKEASCIRDIDFSIDVLKIAIRRLEEEKRIRKLNNKD